LNYIWEVLLAAQKQGTQQEKLAFTDAKSYSPYMEVSFDDLNPATLDRQAIEVNVRYRFSPIFEALLDGRLDTHPDIRERLTDVFIHLLGELDLQSGLCRSEYYGLFLKEDIQDVRFGAQFAETMQLFHFDMRRFVVEYLVRLYTLGPSIELLRSLLRHLYPHSMIYLDSTDERELLVYIGQKETAELAGQMEFLMAFFVPFDYIVHLFWDLHFGIINIDETMELDDFYIY